MVKGGLLYEEAFYGLRWCWLFAGGKCFLRVACVWLVFSKFVDWERGGKEMGIAEHERLIAVSSAWESRELVYWDLRFLNTEGERARRSGFGISFSALSLRSLRPFAKDCRP